MSGHSLGSAIESVRAWTGSRSESGHASRAQTALVVSCSMHDRGRGGPCWPVDATWNAGDVQTLGNETRDRRAGEAVRVESLLE